MAGLQSIGLRVPTGRDLAPAPEILRTDGVRLRRITRLYAHHAALRAIDLDVGEGEVVVLRGPNGAGKSTVLRVISTAIVPTYGGGSVLGHDLLDERDRIRAATELLGHHSRLYEDLSALENLRFVCALSGLGTDRIPQVLEQVGLIRARDERVRGYSQGMRQRVALARLLLRDPRLLLLDEPYAGLDEEGKDLVDRIVSEAAAVGRSVVLATHDHARAVSSAREVWMDEGRIVADVTGTADVTSTGDVSGSPGGTPR